MAAAKANPYLSAQLTDLRDQETILAARVETVQSTLDNDNTNLKNVRAAIKALEGIVPAEPAPVEEKK